MVSVAAVTSKLASCVLPALYSVKNLVDHLQQLANMHARPLQFSAIAEPVLSEGVLAHASSERQALLPETDPLPTSMVPQADLIQKLSHLEMQVVTLQQHLAGLALELLQERTQHYEQRLQTLEARLGLPPQQDRLISALQSAREQRSQPDKPLNTRRVHPTKGRPRAILPLIEYIADGTYIVICPHQGELALTPDSPAWFAWLETISSLRFLGQQGRWSAYRDKGRASHCWFAYRRINGHQYVRALGSPAVLMNSQLPGSSRWRPRFNHSPRLPSVCGRPQIGFRANCFPRSATVVHC